MHEKSFIISRPGTLSNIEDPIEIPQKGEFYQYVWDSSFIIIRVNLCFRHKSKTTGEEESTRYLSFLKSKH